MSTKPHTSETERVAFTEVVVLFISSCYTAIAVQRNLFYSLSQCIVIFAHGKVYGGFFANITKCISIMLQYLDQSIAFALLKG